MRSRRSATGAASASSSSRRASRSGGGSTVLGRPVALIVIGRASGLSLILGTLRPMVADVLAIDVDGAKTLALALVGGFVVLSIVSAIVIKKITTKLISTLLLVGLALGVWTQRSELQDCAERARDRAAAGIQGDLSCSFFGTDV